MTSMSSPIPTYAYGIYFILSQETNFLEFFTINLFLEDSYSQTNCNLIKQNI